MEDEYESFDGSEPKSPSAIDFYDFNDVLSDEEENTIKTSVDESPSPDAGYSRTCSTEEPDVAVSNIGAIIPDKPLAGVLPVKYQEADVRTFFPHYDPQKNLRFQRVFSYGKQSNKPEIWRSIKKRQQEEKAQKKFAKKDPPRECEVESDEEIKFMQDKSSPQDSTAEEKTINGKPLNNQWRHGPAKVWYDMVLLPESAETYDYGFKLKESQLNDEQSTTDDISDDAFLMVSQNNWEDDVIWDGDDIKMEVENKVFEASKACGWIPFDNYRTITRFRENTNHLSRQPENISKIPYNNISIKKITESLFPVENYKLLYDRWEDDVIWDVNQMPRISYPKPVEINDPDIILEIPDDKPPVVEPVEPLKDRKDKKSRPAAKKVSEEDSSSPITKVDFYNISNDEYYNPKMTKENALKLNCGGFLLQHSIPALELRPPYFPTTLGVKALQRYHRPTLKIYSHGPFAYFGDFHGVRSLSKHIEHKAKERQRELEESGGGEMFFMRTPSDLTGQDGNIVLFEFSEEFPPLMNQIGMASKIRNYYRRRPDKETSVVNYKYGEMAYAHTSPFLGSLQPGHSLQAYENNMFRAPIYEHEIPSTDFLIIRTRYNYYIREVGTIYTVGQELPLTEVPTPKSEKAKNLIRSFLNVFLYRSFLESEEVPPKIRMEVIKKAFPEIQESSARKCLNQCASFQRTGSDTKYWVLNENFRLPSEEEIRKIMTPEQYCTYYSMLCAAQRLKDAGYEDKYGVLPEEENEFFQNKMDDEIKAAPWNTTQSFISSLESKCLLELIGAADPTGCGEGFSYVKISNKPQWSKDENNQNPTKRLVRGTDADLRKLSVSNAKKLLRSYNVPDKEIKNLTRWEIIHIVRTMSTEQAKLGEGGVVPKFARGNFYSQAEHARRYKEECQRIFDLQNSVLSSKEVLSSDEDSSSENDSDIEEMGKHIESIISNKKTAEELSHESEEAERKELKKLIASKQPIKDTQKIKEEKLPSTEGKILKIYRTYRNSMGTEYERVETVRRPAVIQLYTKIREEKDEDFVKNYSLDAEQKEAIRKEKRRIQDQLRRLKRNESKEKTNEPSFKKKNKVETSLLKVKCGACGASGHMRTNRTCPFYHSTPSLPPVQVAMTEEQEEEAAEQTILNEQNLVKVDETKIYVSKQLLKHADEVRRKSLVLKIPKDTLVSAKKKRSYEMSNSDYLSTPKLANRKRTDPIVSISCIFENLISQLKSLPDTQPFWFPVNAKLVPNYYKLIDKPMDLNTMKEKVRQHKYKSREDFIKDLQQIIDNSTKYNGAHSFFTMNAASMLECCIKVFSEKEERLMDLEKAINPLLDSDQVAFSFILETIVTEQLQAVPKSWPFHKPVNKRTKGYYDVVKNPIDLSTIISYCKAHRYKTRQAFLDDVELILSNSVLFNGPTSNYTSIAEEIVKACHVSLDIYKEQLQKLEAGLQNSNITDSIVNNSSFVPKKRKITRKERIEIDHTAHSSKYNGSLDADSFVDVESLDDNIPENNCEKKLKFSDNSDYELDNIGNSYAEDLDLSEKSEEEEANPVLSNSFLDDLNISDSDEENTDGMKPSGEDLDLNNCDLASPSVSSNIQSLLPINGFLEAEDTGINTSTDIQQPYSQNTCDNICDDLILSSDSEEEMLVDNVLQF